MLRIREDDGTIRDENGYTPPTNGQAPPSDWRSIFNAPSYTDLMRPAQSANAKEYADKCKAMLKSGVVAAIKVGDFPDAATILAYGPGLADAAGQLADESEWTAKAIDLLTSPGSAPLTFALAASTFVYQIVRNHEDVLKELPNSRKNAKLRKRAMQEARKAEPPRFTIRIFKREFPIRYRPRYKMSAILGAFRAQTRDPVELTHSVFTDPKVLTMLRKQGIVLVNPNDTPPAP